MAEQLEMCAEDGVSDRSFPRRSARLKRLKENKRKFVSEYFPEQARGSAEITRSILTHSRRIKKEKCAPTR